MNPLGILQFIWEMIMDIIFYWASWRFAVCFFAGVGAGWVILEVISATPHRWILAGSAVGLGIFLGDRWERGVS